jgi:hypothetical protein
LPALVNHGCYLCVLHARWLHERPQPAVRRSHQGQAGINDLAPGSVA